MTKQYLELAEKIMSEGQVRDDRTGVGTIGIFGHQMRFNLQDGFPILTTKRVAFGLVKSELLWFLRGDTNIRYLLEHNNHVWDEWAFKNWVESDEYKGPDMTDFGIKAANDPEFKAVYDTIHQEFCDKVLTDDAFSEKFGDLGFVYGAQWRKWRTRDGQIIDQISNIIDQIKSQPNSRRIILSAWNPEDIPTMALPPCHTMSQFYVQDGKLSCQLYQRSADLFLGVPFNIASYALLTHLLANECGLEVGEFIHTFGDVHIYSNHIDQIKEQLSRETQKLPTLILKSPEKSLFDLTVDDILLEDYKPLPAIKAPIAV